jgi:hypothetical protein
MRETDLYGPVRSFLEGQGYSVRGEVGPCDVMAVRDGMVLAVELKLILNLRLILQAVDRLAFADGVYIAVPHGAHSWKSDRRGVLKLLRMLGLGLLLVDPSTGAVQPELDPGRYEPRINRKQRGRLLREHAALTGDPNPGGCSRRRGVMTLYRRKAVSAALYLRENGPSRAATVSGALGMPDAHSILYRNVYGWFERRERGVYGLSPRGLSEVPSWE